MSVFGAGLAAAPPDARVAALPLGEEGLSPRSQTRRKGRRKRRAGRTGRARVEEQVHSSDGEQQEEDERRRPQHASPDRAPEEDGERDRVSVGERYRVSIGGAFDLD